MEEIQPLIPPSKKTKDVIYKRRWWLLATFSLSGVVQNIVWNTWGPIAQSAKGVFGWSDGQIGMFPMVANVAFIFTMFFACYLMDEKGLRISVLVCDGLVFAGSGIRCITSVPKYATWFMNIGAVLNGIAGTAFCAGPALISSIWFPPNQRSTATAVASAAQFIGFAASFIIGPELVSSPKYNTTVQTHSSFYSDDEQTTAVISNISHNHTVLTNFDQVREDIMQLMYYECGLAGLIFIAVLIYFPDKPPTAPSYTASMSRVNYVSALGKIIRKGPLWLIVSAYAIPTGIYGSWGTVLDIILNPSGVSQTEVGWIGFFSTIAGGIGSLCIARFSDIVMKHMKLFLIVLYIGGAGACAWCTLLCSKVLLFSEVELYASCILIGMFINSGIPLFYELSCETSYPIAEGVTGGFLALINSIFGTTFLLVLQNPNFGVSWMNWALLGSIGAGLIFLITFPERYGRTDLDIAAKRHTDLVIDVHVPEPDQSENIPPVGTSLNIDIKGEQK